MWREKLADDKGLPVVKVIGEEMGHAWGPGTMVIPAPREVDEIMRAIPEGKLITLNEIRGILAEKHGATIACPLTTGIFAWIAAHAASEEVEEAGTVTTPYWRTLKTGGELNPKYPGGIEAQRKLLESEGHTVIQKGKKHLVDNYRAVLAQPFQGRKSDLL